MPESPHHIEPIETPEQIAEREAGEKFQSDFSASMEKMFEILFSQPKEQADTVSKMAAAHWARLNSNPNYKNRVEQVKLKVSLTKQRLFDAIRKKVADRDAATAETQRLLAGLNASLRQTAVMAQAMKVQKTPFRHLDSEQQETKQETFETAELMAFQSTLELLEQLSPEEMIDMALENQEITTMLAETQGLANIFEPMGGTQYDKVDGKQVAKFDKEKNPNYWKNMETLYEFVMEGNARGGPRSALETDMWHEIVRGLTAEQRADFISRFIAHGNEGKGLELMMQLVTTGIMAKEEALKIFDQLNVGEPPVFENLAKKYPGKFPKGARASVAGALERAEAIAAVREEDVEKLVHQLKTRKIDNAVTYFFNFNTLVLSRLAELGALTAILNAGGEIFDAVKSKKDDEGYIKAVAKGVLNTGTNKYFWAGAGTAALTTTAVLRDVIDWHEPTTQEAEFVAAKKGAEWIRKEVAKHPYLSDYMFKHYEQLYASAKDQQEKYPKRGFVPYADSIKVTQQEAAALGYGTDSVGVMRAKGKIIEFFKVGAAMQATTTAQLKTELESRDIGLA